MDGIYPRNYYYRLAKKISYRGYVALSKKEWIIIHNTGNDGDTAKNNVDYFATGNTRSAGAQLFVSKNGGVAQSMPINYIAYAVGDKKNGTNTYWGIATNTNTINIEVCDIKNKDMSQEQLDAIRDVVAWIKSVCPNIKGILRHGDITHKLCPQRYMSTEKWLSVKNYINGGTYTPTINTEDYQGEFGTEWIKRLQKHYGTTVDGVISGQKQSLRKYYTAIPIACCTWTGTGSELVRAIQKKYGCKEDGLLGKDTISAWQRQLFGEDSSEVDGYWGKKTSDEIKKWI